MFHRKAPREPKSVLLYVVPGFGDVLLATPLLRSIQLAYPRAKITVIVRAGRESMLEGVAGVAEVVGLSRRASYFDSFKALLLRLRSFDISFSTSPSDRAALFCFFTSKYRLQVLEPKSLANLWKYLLADAVSSISEDEHVVSRNLALLDSLDIRKQFELLLPRKDSISGKVSTLSASLADNYCVLQPVASAEYKQWSLESWRESINFILDSGFKVLLSCGAAESERAYCETLALDFDERVVSSEGQLSFAELRELISGAELFVGVDTAVTHLAAALGVRTVAIFGPTNRKMWGPWPSGFENELTPYTEAASVELRANVVLLSSACECIPIGKNCKLSGTSRSACLQAIPAQLLCEQIAKLLG